jgi:hypothetical protein
MVLIFLSKALLKSILLAVSEKVNPGQPGGTKPRVHRTKVSIGHLLCPLISCSWTGQPGCRRSRAGEKAAVSLFVNSAIFLFEKQPAALFGEAGRFFLRQGPELKPMDEGGVKITDLCRDAAPGEEVS